MIEVSLFVAFYTPNNFSGCTTLFYFLYNQFSFIPLTILVGVQHLVPKDTEFLSFIPLTILVGVQLEHNAIKGFHVLYP